MWLNETLASGMVPYYHFIGSEAGFGEDRRWQKVGTDYFQWTAKHDAHFKARRSIANIGVVMGQSTQLLYKGPATAHSREYMRETTQGIYERSSAAASPSTSCTKTVSIRNASASIALFCCPISPCLATANASRSVTTCSPADRSWPASRPASTTKTSSSAPISASPICSASTRPATSSAPNGNAYYGRIERQHPILAGFTDTNWLPGAQNRLPLKPVQHPVLTVVPGFVQYPPELAYPSLSHTEEPAVVLRETGSSRMAWFPGDIERTYWLTGHGDLLRLLHNTIRWITRDESIVHVEGEGFIEMFAWETDPWLCRAPAQLHQPQHPPRLDAVDLPARPADRQDEAAAGVKVKSVELLSAGHTVPFRLAGQVLQLHHTARRRL